MQPLRKERRPTSFHSELSEIIYKAGEPYSHLQLMQSVFHHQPLYFSCFRVHTYIRNGWSRNFSDPDGKGKQLVCRGAEPLPLVAVQMPDEAKDGCQLLKEAFAGKVSKVIFTFTSANIISYFVMRTAVDGMPANSM